MGTLLHVGAKGYDGLMHTFFVLEDRYGLKIVEMEGELYLCLDKTRGTEYWNMFEMLFSWCQVVAKLGKGHHISGPQ